MLREDLVEGWTGRIIETLKSNNSPINLTGMTAQLFLYDNTGAPFPYTGTAGVLAGSERYGKVYFDPAATDLLAIHSTYGVRWKVTDGNGKVVWFPNQVLGQWYVSKP